MFNKDLEKENLRLKEEIEQKVKYIALLEESIKRRDDQLMCILDPNKYLTFKRFNDSIRKERTPNDQEKKDIKEFQKNRAQDAEALTEMINAANGGEPIDVKKGVLHEQKS